MGRYGGQDLFEPGRAFPHRQARSPQDYLDAALAAQRHIATFQREDQDGIHWVGPGQDPLNVTVYSGDAGLVLFHLQLNLARVDAGVADVARRSAHRLALHWRDALGNVPYPFIDDLEYGFQYGVAGIGSVLLLAREQFQDPVVDTALGEILDFFSARARHDQDGIRWTGATAPVLDGGILLFLVRMAQALDPGDTDTRARLDTLIRGSADRILSTGRRSVTGGLVFDGVGAPRGYTTPNFELGSAGIGYVLAEAYSHTADQRHLQGARDAATYLEEVSLPQGNGFLIPVRIEDDGTFFTGNGDLLADDGDRDPDRGELPGAYTEPIFYMGVCHGPAGTDRLYHVLGRITGEAQYTERIHRHIDGFEHLGAPERQSPGLWSTYYCCGHASMLQLFVGLYEGDHDPRWLDLVTRTADVLLGGVEDLGEAGANWPVSYFRIRPTQVSRGIGYYDGSAGIAASLLHAHACLEGSFLTCRLADDPLPTGARPRPRPRPRATEQPCGGETPGGSTTAGEDLDRDRHRPHAALRHPEDPQQVQPR